MSNNYIIEKLLTAKEVGEILRLSRRQIFRLNSCGKIPRPIRIGGAVRWAETTILAWLQAEAPDRKTWDSMSGTLKRCYEGRLTRL